MLPAEPEVLLPAEPEMLLPAEPEMLLPHDQSQSPAATLAMILDFVFEDLVGPTLFQGSCFPNSTVIVPFTFLIGPTCRT